MSRTDKFVFDTNVLISSVLVKNSIPFKSLEKAKILGQLVFSKETFLEFETVLFRKKFDKYFSVQERLLIIERIRAEIIIIDITSDFNICRDQKDNKFLNLAFDAEASIIITGDDDLLSLHPFSNTQILSPSIFLEIH